MIGIIYYTIGVDMEQGYLSLNPPVADKSALFQPKPRLKCPELTLLLGGGIACKLPFLELTNKFGVKTVTLGIIGE